MDEEKRSNQNYEIIESCTIGSRGTLQGVSKSDGGSGYGKAERFIRAGV